MRHLHITESGGLYFASSKRGGDVQSSSLEGLLEKLDPGNEPRNYSAAAGIIEKALGPKRDGDHGHIRQGLVGT